MSQTFQIISVILVGFVIVSVLCHMLNRHPT
ncbi:hypothetical protein MTTB_15430 [Methanothermobacter tenebrarum]|uniref:Uncharacterized protein n=1 Tax=Methanothermobacter tenebrarum TaxID=680118 RepID=A0ABM7YFP2_9EURY|nr:hypothetical protein MTTB_15430 [Methanothermobacter tenebrarum]